MNKKTRMLLIAITVAIAFPCMCLAQDKYELNIRAYKGIQFSEIFGSVGDLEMSFPFASGVEWDQALVKSDSAISLGKFVDRVALNLRQYGSAPAEDLPLIEDVSCRVTRLAAYLNGLEGAGAWISEWPVRWFFENDLKRAVLSDVDLQASVQALFVDHLEPLEEIGLTFPWLLVASKGTYGELFDLFYDSRFLQRFARIQYEDFFTVTVENPLVDDEFMELAQAAIQIGLLGAFQVYKANPEASVTPQALAGGIVPLGSFMCCHRVERVCKTSGYYTSYCNMCGTYCCIGSTWCP